jgi:hypothetical protein
MNKNNMLVETSNEKVNERNSSKFFYQIIEKTTSEIRTFLDELANGTSNYKSLHNLTEQVEHQYHGRFLIELIQNAHDALFEEDINGDQGRLEVVIVEEEDPFGALYVANDGCPFTDSNFQHLSKFGQSDKDPEKHIGNKGIGFRSVLEVTRSPEIYSRREHNSETFDGYCFWFTPDVTRQFESPIKKLLQETDQPISPLDPRISLVEWGKEKLMAFRSRCSSLGHDWLVKELRYLSPYLLPLPIDINKKTAQVKKFEDRGFATVIRLPFISEKVRDFAISELESLDEKTVLFLDRVKNLWIDSGKRQRFVVRKKRRLSDSKSGYEVEIETTETEQEIVKRERYWLWEQTIGGEENLQEAELIQEAVSDLPGKWPELRKATFSIAVRLGEVSEKGKIHIFLPTELTSGCGAHLNGPFYGDISRAHINFAHPFNELLLSRIVEKVIDVVLYSLAGKGLDEARAIIDMLSPFPETGDSGSRWWSLVGKTYSKTGRRLEEENIIFAQDGWNNILNTSLLPDLKEHQVINEEELRSEATFPVFHQGLLSRKDQLHRLYAAIRVSISPSDEDLASTVEKIAKKLHNKVDIVDWNGFLSDVSKLFPEGAEKLKGREILIGTDNELHASSDKSSVFFRPRSGGTDDEIQAAGAIDDIPENLRPHIAFLHECVQVHIPRPEGGIQVTGLQRYLSSGLVQQFGVEQILRGVLIPATPKLPIALGSRYGKLCRDIIQWGLRLVANLVAKDKGEKTLGYLGMLPVPCKGGWFTLNEACFGPGWNGTGGQNLYDYLESVNTKECQEAMAKLMLPPDDIAWGGIVSQYQDILAKAGAFDGMRMIKIIPEDWNSKFDISGWSGVKLPEKPPPCFDEKFWKSYLDLVAKNLRPNFTGLFSYVVQELYALPGLDQFDEFDKNTRLHLMTVLLRSLPRWAGQWGMLEIEKVYGVSHRYRHESPLHFWLRQKSWLVLSKGVDLEYSRPAERWYIPSLVLAGRSHQFTHLNPLPGEIAVLLDGDGELVNVLEDLGISKYDPETPNDSTRLLNDLAQALENPEVEIIDKNVFLGQVRMAWNLFEPDEESIFPKRIIVISPLMNLQTVNPSEDAPVYLPDSTSVIQEGLELHSKPIVAIETKDARRLANGFSRAYGKGVRLASQLKMQPLVDKKPWEGDMGAPLATSDLKWLMPIILSIFAFSGVQARGTQTKTFLKAIDNLREAKICWVDSLEAGLWQGDEVIATTPVLTLWLPRNKILLSIMENKKTFSSLSEAFGTIMDRADLDIPLKLVLGRIEGRSEITREEIVESLKQLKISESHLAEVEQSWLGNLSWTIRLIKPILLSINSKAQLGYLTEINSEEELRRYLENQDLAGLKIDEVLSITKNCDSFYTLGMKLFGTLGEQFQLDKWNNVLNQLGESVVKNDDSIDQFNTHLAASRLPLRAILRRVVRDNPEIGFFNELGDKLENISCPEEYSEKYWNVEFWSVMQFIKPLFVSWKASPEELDAINQAKSTEDLISRLAELKLEPTLDPLEIYVKNREKSLTILQKVQQAAIIWCLKNGLETSIWEEESEDLLEWINDPLEKEGYIEIWNDEKSFSALKNLPRNESHQTFWEKYDESKNVNDLLKTLSISAGELAKAKEKLDQHKEKIQEQKRMVTVCGKEFDSAEDNLQNLWNHIVGEIDDGSLPDVSLDRLAELKEISSKKERGGDGGSKDRQKKSLGRMTQAKKNLIGLAGEIHAYRVLLKTYGPGVMNPNCWVSENSLRKFPQNKVSDNYGCDFEIHYKGKTYFIEAKATEGEEEFFELGLSEIRRALEVANRRSSKFLILRITKALSTEPEFQFLPNPYEKQHQKSYDIQNAGLRIKYNKSS